MNNDRPGLTPGMPWEFYFEMALAELIREQLDDVQETISRHGVEAAEGPITAYRQISAFRHWYMLGEWPIKDIPFTNFTDLVEVRMDRHRMIREGVLDD